MHTPEASGSKELLTLCQWWAFIWGNLIQCNLDSYTLFLLWLVFLRSAVQIITLRLRTKANRFNTQDKNICSSKQNKEHEKFYLNDLNQLINPTLSRKHWLQSKTQSQVSILVNYIQNNPYVSYIQNNP